MDTGAAKRTTHGKVFPLCRDCGGRAEQRREPHGVCAHACKNIRRTDILGRPMVSGSTTAARKDAQLGDGDTLEQTDGRPREDRRDSRRRHFPPSHIARQTVARRTQPAHSYSSQPSRCRKRDSNSTRCIATVTQSAGSPHP